MKIWKKILLGLAILAMAGTMVEGVHRANDYMISSPNQFVERSYMSNLLNSTVLRYTVVVPNDYNMVWVEPLQATNATFSNALGIGYFINTNFAFDTNSGTWSTNYQYWTNWQYSVSNYTITNYVHLFSATNYYTPTGIFYNPATLITAFPSRVMLQNIDGWLKGVIANYLDEDLAGDNDKADTWFKNQITNWTWDAMVTNTDHPLPWTQWVAHYSYQDTPPTMTWRKVCAKVGGTNFNYVCMQPTQSVEGWKTMQYTTKYVTNYNVYATNLNISDQADGSISYLARTMMGTNPYVKTLAIMYCGIISNYSITNGYSIEPHRILGFIRKDISSNNNELASSSSDFPELGHMLPVTSNWTGATYWKLDRAKSNAANFDSLTFSLTGCVAIATPTTTVQFIKDDAGIFPMSEYYQMFLGDNSGYMTYGSNVIDLSVDSTGDKINTDYYYIHSLGSTWTRDEICTGYSEYFGSSVTIYWSNNIDKLYGGDYDYGSVPGGPLQLTNIQQRLAIIKLLKSTWAKPAQITSNSYSWINSLYTNCYTDNFANLGSGDWNSTNQTNSCGITIPVNINWTWTLQNYDNTLIDHYRNSETKNGTFFAGQGAEIAQHLPSTYFSIVLPTGLAASVEWYSANRPFTNNAGGDIEPYSNAYFVVSNGPYYDITFTENETSTTNTTITNATSFIILSNSAMGILVDSDTFLSYDDADDKSSSDSNLVVSYTVSGGNYDMDGLSIYDTAISKYTHDYFNMDVTTVWETNLVVIPPGSTNAPTRVVTGINVTNYYPAENINQEDIDEYSVYFKYSVIPCAIIRWTFGDESLFIAKPTIFTPKQGYFRAKKEE